MLSKHTGRLVVALVAAVAMLFAATPASANPVDATIVGGQLIITQDDEDIDIDLDGPPEENPCDSQWYQPEVQLKINKSTTPWEVTVEDVDFPVSSGEVDGSVYELAIQLEPAGNNSGQIDGSDWSQGVALRGLVYDQGSAANPDCDATTPDCELVVFLNLEGSYDPGPPESGLFDSAQATGDPIFVDPGSNCDVDIEGAFDGESVIVNNLALEF